MKPRVRVEPLKDGPHERTHCFDTSVSRQSIIDNGLTRSVMYLWRDSAS
jgi:hypothetical protein